MLNLAPEALACRGIAMLYRPAAFIISPRDMQDLQDARRKRSAAVAAFDAWSKAAAETALPAAAELSDADIVQMVKESR